MTDIVSKITNSQPTITGDNALKTIESLLDNPNYVLFSSQVLGFDVICEMVDDYIKSSATIELPDGNQILTLQPISIIHAIEPHEPHKVLWALFYANGMVVYVVDPSTSSQYMYLFVNKDLVEQGLQFLLEESKENE